MTDLSLKEEIQRRTCHTDCVLSDLKIGQGRK